MRSIDAVVYCYSKKKVGQQKHHREVNEYEDSIP